MPHAARVVFAALMCHSLVAISTAHTYSGPTDGACRGPGGVDDKVNSKIVHERNESDCMQDCDDEDFCTGFAYHPDANGGECIVYGFSMSGSCSDSSATTPDDCAALGTCEDLTLLSEDECGYCSETSATSTQSCASVNGEWTALTWTSAGATWNDPEDPWFGEYQYSSIVVGVSSNAAGYQCWDVDATDHHATCTSDPDVNDLCASSFNGLTEDEMISDNCLSGCTFTAAVSGPSTVSYHAPTIEDDNYEVKSGACRSPDGNKVNGKYSNTAGENGQLTQAECMQECDSEPTCAGYAHSTSWCVVYGPEIDESPGDDWTSDEHTDTTIGAMKVNVAYVCAVKLADEASSAGGPRGCSTAVFFFLMLASALVMTK